MIVKGCRGLTTTVRRPGTALPSIPIPMTLRITAAGPDPPATVKIDGRLTGEETPELRRVCTGIKGWLVLDLTDLQSADREGISVLRELRAKGANLIGASPYVQLLLHRPPRDLGP